MENKEVETTRARSRPGEGGSGTKTLLVVLAVVAFLCFARTIFIPLALAMLGAFFLAPAVNRLRACGVGRVFSVLTVVMVTVALAGVVGALLISQLSDLAHKLPGYQQNIQTKPEAIRNSREGFLRGITRIGENLSAELGPQPPAPAKTQPGEQKPVPVEIRRSPLSPLEAIQTVLGSLLKVLVIVGISTVFVIFMLVEQEDLRDRFIKLAGAAHVPEATKLLDDAAERVSRYLRAQAGINAAYGGMVGLGLYSIGIPNPLLWGTVAALFRYIPYAGIWVAASMPAMLAFAVEPGWLKAPLILGVFFGIDLLVYNVVEPLLYGTSTGVSPLAVLVAAVFWAWLWGPAGLLLATPLTVCLVVLGRHVPNLRFLRILLSDEPVLSPPTRFYQRLLAMDLDEATDVAEKYLKDRSLEDVYDEVIIRALSLAEEDRHRGRLDEEQQEFLFRNTRLLIEDLAERFLEPASEVPPASGKRLERGGGVGPQTGRSADGGTQVLCVPASDEADELAALMLVRLLEHRGIGAEARSIRTPGQHASAELGLEKPRLVCVCAIPPFAYVQVRYVCRRLRAQVEGLRLVAAFLTEGDVEDINKRQPGIPAEELAVSLKQTVTSIISLPGVQDGSRFVRAEEGMSESKDQAA